jgi:hypothetical protein
MNNEEQSEKRMTELCNSLRREKTFNQGDSIIATYTVRERTLWLVVHFDAVVSIGGFPEYFCRPVSLYIEETTAALIRVGALKAALAYVRAVELFFGSGAPMYVDTLSGTEQLRLQRRDSLTDAECRIFDELLRDLDVAKQAEGYWTRLESYWDQQVDELSPAS